ncbi:MAG: hypothetical protein E7413_07440 [Ruminococcaceae bacterium]|nr:hypothetical protein [Oscillospiraceae bacterium]
MVEQDTIKLLRECDAGVKMGISSLADVLPLVGDGELKTLLEQCKKRHEELESDLEKLLDKYQDDGKDPAFVAKGMSWLKTNVKLMMNASDQTIADLMTDGCNMGVKSLHMYLNQYRAADEESKRITKRLIDLEETLAMDIRKFL